MPKLLPAVIKKSLRTFVHNGVYLFPDGHVYVAQRPVADLTWSWTFWTLDNFVMGLSYAYDVTWSRWVNGEWTKRVPRTKKNRFGIKPGQYIDKQIKFTGTVLAGKKKGVRLPKPDRDWFWTAMTHRERTKYGR
jgi:hypothetical protein